MSVIINFNINNFNNLPADIHRLLALYLDIHDLIDFCRLNKNSDKNVHKNQIFLRDLGRLRLSLVDERFQGKNIIREIYETTDFITALNKGYLERIKYISNIKIFHDANRRMPIYGFTGESVRLAAHSGYLDIIKCMISHGVDIRGCCDSALMRATAINAGHLDVVKYLIENGADVHYQDDLPLILACANGYLSVVKYLISRGANIHAQKGKALISANMNLHPDVVKYLKSLE